MLSVAPTRPPGWSAKEVTISGSDLDLDLDSLVRRNGEGQALWKSYPWL